MADAAAPEAPPAEEAPAPAPVPEAPPAPAGPIKTWKSADKPVSWRLLDPTQK